MCRWFLNFQAVKDKIIIKFLLPSLKTVAKQVLVILNIVDCTESQRGLASPGVGIRLDSYLSSSPPPPPPPVHLVSGSSPSCVLQGLSLIPTYYIYMRGSMQHFPEGLEFLKEG